jgi:hypothetical protein
MKISDIVLQIVLAHYVFLNFLNVYVKNRFDPNSKSSS